jgi:multidrug efflux pump subunit AcrA (membrane-fusion protein)
MSRLATTLLTLFTIGCPIAGCVADPEPIAPDPEAANATTAPTRWVEVRRPSDGSILEAPAIVRAASATGDVSATVRVRVQRLHVQPGSVVAVDDPIVDVAAPELLDAAATYVGAGRRARTHADRADELDALRGEGLVSRAQVFEQRSSASDLEAERDRAGAVLRAAGLDPRESAALLRTGTLTLRAPVAGVIVELAARTGEIREAGSGPLARIYGEAPARVEVRTSEAWPTASAVTFDASDGRRFELAPTPLSTVVDPHDGTRVSWYAPRETVVLPDGLAGRARVVTSDDVWEVPVGAVAQRTGESELLRRRGDSQETVSVEVLGSSGASALVRGPLTEGDRVAAELEAHRAPATSTDEGPGQGPGESPAP